MGWGKYLVALAVVVAGLVAVDAVAPRATLLIALLIVLGAAILRPSFLSELQKLTSLAPKAGG